MMRIVLDIRRNGRTGDLWMSLAEPSGDPAGMDFYPFPYDSADPVPAGFLAGTLGTDKIGDYIVGKLAAHPSVPSTLATALATQARVFVRVAPQAEEVPWETLFRNGNFLALDPRWPIGRISAQEPLAAPPAEFRPPLRVVAVLAAAGVDAARQWTELRKALRAFPFDVTVRVLAAQDTVLNAARASSGGNLTVTAEFVPPGTGLPAQISAFRPNILHFFCHGGVEGGASFLDIATRSTAGAKRGGVILEMKDFPVTEPAGDLWLVVLNACLGASAPAGTASLVSALAARGIPAVAGMREAVSADDAHDFCRGFYRALATLFGPLATGSGPVTVAWCDALYHARLEICDRHRGGDPCSVAAKRSREWTLPVMYVRAAPFVLSRPQAWAVGPVRSSLLPHERTAYETELGVLRNVVARGLGAPPAVITAYQERIAALEVILAD
jgi:hypothetical protein